MTGESEHGVAVAEAVEQPYRVFARYPQPRCLDTSPLRDADAILRALRSAPLRELNPKELLSYAGSAMTTVGGVDEYRHFLPRIVELALDDPPYLGAEPWLIASRLNYPAYKACWLEAERQAVRATFSAAWAQALTQDPMVRDAEKWLCGLAYIGDVADALETWRCSPSPYALEHFAEFVTHHQQHLLDGRGVSGGSWDAAASEARAEIREWTWNADLSPWLQISSLPSDHWVRWWIENDRKALHPGSSG